MTFIEISSPSTNNFQLVMNNFTSPATDSEESSESKKKIPRHLESLTTTIFQSLFPPISPQSTPLNSIRRVLLLNREKSTKPEEEGAYILNLRHYAITTKSVGVSRPLRRLNAAEKLITSNAKGRKKGLPNLGKLEDIADYMIGGEGGEGYVTDLTSGSEVDTDAEIEVLESTTRKVLSRKEQQRRRNAEEKAKEGSGASGVEKRAVKMVELGPRLKLRMTKVEDGVCTGKTMWHEYISKSKEELKQMDKVWEKRRQEKDERKRIQKENVERKRAAKGLGAKGREGEDDEDDEMDVDEWDSEGLEGDAEMELNEKMDENGDWEEEEEEIAAG
jgi:ribosome biogenesis protein SSF1/2